MHSRSLFALLIATSMSATLAAQRGGGPTGPQQASTPEPLKFRYMGPAPAGRIAAVAGVPGDPSQPTVFAFGNWRNSHRTRHSMVSAGN